MATLATVLAYGLWNLVLDGVVLYLAIRLRGRTPSWRLGFGAVIGAAYAFVPAGLSGGLPGHLACAGAMCLAAAAYSDLRDFATQWAAALGTAVLLGGVSFGLAVMLTGHVPTAAHPAPGFTALTAGLFLVSTERAAAAFRVRRWAQAALSRNSLAVDLRVRVGDRIRSVSGLIDTGNRLRDPITHRPVVILAPGVFLDLVPEEARDGFRLATTAADTVGAVHEGIGHGALSGCGADGVLPPWAARVQVIPYRGIGGRGLLTALRPDGIWEVRPDGRERPVGPALVGLSPTPLAAGVEGVVPPGLLGKLAAGTILVGDPLAEAQDVVTMGA